MKKMMSFLLATALTVGMTAGVAATTYAEEDKKSVGFVTFGLGGDSAIKLGSDELVLSERRVEPICMAVSRWPELREPLQRLLEDGNYVRRELYEVLYRTIV